MFYRHLISDEKIFLYISDYQEFSKEFTDVTKVSKEQTIEQLTKDYLKKHKIDYNNKKIYLVLDGIVISSLSIKEELSKNKYAEMSKYEEYLNEIDLANTKLAKTKVIPLPKFNKSDIDVIKHQVENKKERHQKKYLTDNIPSNRVRKIMIPLYLSDGKIAKVELETYITGIIANVIPIHMHDEAIKAQVLITRTIILKRLFEKKIFTPYIENLTYKTPRQLKIFWKNNYEIYYQKIKDAVNATKGEYISYNNYFINAYYHYANNGKTEDSINVIDSSYPYLKVVNSPWDKESSEYNRITIKDLYVINHLLGMELSKNSKISVLEKTLGGSISKIRINDKIFDGKYLKDILGLRSTDFNLIINDNYINIITKGFGHSLGMSQYGADKMANEGYSYKQIINHFFPNTSIIKLII